MATSEVVKFPQRYHIGYFSDETGRRSKVHAIRNGTTEAACGANITTLHDHRWLSNRVQARLLTCGNCARMLEGVDLP